MLEDLPKFLRVDAWSELLDLDARADGPRLPPPALFSRAEDDSPAHASTKRARTVVSM